MTKDSQIKQPLSIFLKIVAVSFLLTLPAAAVDFEIPAPVVVNQLDGDLSEQQRFPALFSEGSQLALYFHSNGLALKQLRMLKLNPAPELLSVYQLTAMTSRYHPFAPYVAKVDSLNKLLFWYEPDLSGGMYPLDYQHFSFFSSEIPTADDLENNFTFYSQKDHYSVTPDFARVGDKIYFASLRSYETNPAHNSRELFLKSYDLTSQSLTLPTLYFSANGSMALLEKNEKLLLVKSWLYCTDYENLSCVEWSAGYKAYSIEDNKIKTIHPLISFDSYDESDNPTDISAVTISGEELFVLHNERQIVRLNFDRMRFELVADLFYDSPFYTGRMVPFQTVDYNAVAFMNQTNDSIKFCVYDFEWNFIDSTSLKLNGVPLEISDMVYDSSKDAVTFAYSAYSENQPDISQIFLQTVGFSERKLYHVPFEIIPGEFKLAQNYPNPFNPETFVEYYLPEDGRVKIEVFNLLGQRVTTLINDYQDAGIYETSWDGAGHSSGIYLINVQYGDENASVKAVLIK